MFIIVKKEIIEKLKNAEYNNLFDILFRMELTYNEIEFLLDKKRMIDHLLDILLHRVSMKLVTLI